MFRFLATMIVVCGLASDGLAQCGTATTARSVVSVRSGRPHVIARVVTAPFRLLFAGPFFGHRAAMSGACAPAPTIPTVIPAPMPTMPAPKAAPAPKAPAPQATAGFQVTPQVFITNGIFARTSSCAGGSCGSPTVVRTRFFGRFR